MAKQTTIQEFEAVFPKLEAALLEHTASYKLPKKETDWYKLVCLQTLPRNPCPSHQDHC